MLHVGVRGHGPDVVVLTGGPGCVQYLEADEIAPRGYRAWYPEPRGVGRSTGGAHTMEHAVADLETIRASLGVTSWIVVGHSWGCDLGVRYGVERPESVRAVIGVAGTGPQRDRSWAAAYEAAKDAERTMNIRWSPEVHASLLRSFTDWIHSRDLWRGLADCRVPMHLVAAGDDIRPWWPLEQLAALLPHGRFSVIPGVPHDFWSTHPAEWTNAISALCDVAHSGLKDTCR